MLRAIIIDDHESMRANLRRLLALIPEVNIIAEAEGVEEGFNVVQELKPDLLFLDVEMRDGTGFDLLSKLQNKSLNVIFVTGHNDYAIKAFKFSAIDYLLKPIDFDDLEQAVQKVIHTSAPEKRIKNLLENAKKLNRLVLSDQKNTFLIDLIDIIRIASDVNYAKFFLVDSKEIVVAKTLKSYDEMLQASGFFRSHQSHLINLNHFDRLDKSDGGVIYMKNGDTVPLSSRKREGLLEALSSFTFK